MSLEPLRTVWDALAAADCHPHGAAHDFRARCPAHAGENRGSLHVSLGMEGAAVLWCFAHQCPTDAITAALGLTLRDLYPPGHHRADRLPLRPVRRPDFHSIALSVVNVLYALEQLGEPWTLMIAIDCPYCESQGAWLRARSSGYIEADCPEGCTAENQLGALLSRLEQRSAGG